MTAATATARPAPSSLLMAAATLAVTGASVVAWLLIAASILLNPHFGEGWIYVGAALPAATLGSVASSLSDRRLPFLVGLAVTLIPLAVYLVVSATVPPPPEWAAD